jgi:dienelactone hydrolase
MLRLRFSLSSLTFACLVLSTACEDASPDDAFEQHAAAMSDWEGANSDADNAEPAESEGDLSGEPSAEVADDADFEGLSDAPVQLLATQTCCPDGNCVCRGDDPTERLVNGSGPYRTASYSRGFRHNRGDFGGATIYYPTNAEGPLSGVVMCPGYTARQSSIRAWGPLFASHGIVLMTIDTNTTGDQVPARARQLMNALASLKAENTRAGSPLQGKLSADRFGVMGWSMGGGGTWIAAAQNPDLKTAVSLAGHNITAGGARIANGTRVPSLLLAGALDPSILGGSNQSQNVYQVIPNSTPKILYELRNVGHFVWGNPGTNNNALGRYVISFQKAFLDGDQRYLKFLRERGPNASDWRSTVQ